MNKTELIDAIAAGSGLTKADSKKALDAFLEAIQDGLKLGKKISLVGFGSLSVADKPAREARNPRTGETIKVAAKKVVKFKAGAELSNAVN